MNENLVKLERLADGDVIVEIRNPRYSIWVKQRYTPPPVDEELKEQILEAVKTRAVEKYNKILARKIQEEIDFETEVIQIWEDTYSFNLYVWHSQDDKCCKIHVKDRETHRVLFKVCANTFREAWDILTHNIEL